MQTKSQKVFLKPFPLDIIKYSTFRENCQSSECIKIGGKNCIACLLTKTRSVLSVHRPPRRICENWIKTRWSNPPSFCWLTPQETEQVTEVETGLVLLFLRLLCQLQHMGLDVVKHIQRHLVLAIWTTVASIAASETVGLSR